MPIAEGTLETMQICKLLQCVRENDKRQIETLCENGIPHLINYNEPNAGETALTVASAQSNDDMINFLIDIGAHPDVVDFKGRNAVMRAAEYGHVQCLEALVEKAKADMEIQDLEGKCVIHYCLQATQRHQDCLTLALQKGADVNSATKDGKPVFHAACEQGPRTEDMALMLLRKGADPNGLHEAFHRTALMAAAATGCANLVREILEHGGEVNTVDKMKVHAAHEAAKGGFFDVLVALGAYGAKFEVQDKKGNTPMHLAAAKGHAMCCKFLGQRGCNPKTKNYDGDTPKILAKEGSHKEAGKELRKIEATFGKGGKLNEPSSIALYDFVYARQDQCLSTFKKFDPDNVGTIPKEEFIDCLQNMGGPMPPDSEMEKLVKLHAVDREGNMEYEEFLTGKKYVNKTYLMASFEAKKKKNKSKGGKTQKGKTKILMPICYQEDGIRAEDGGPPKAFIAQHIHFTDNNRFNRDKPPAHPLQDDSAWYLAHPEKRYININDAARNADIDSLRETLVRGTDINTRDKYYKTPLMIGCSLGNIDVVKFLVNAGADVNARDNFKWTPLHHACHSGLIDVVEYLLDHGAEIDATTLNGGTPLYRAIESAKLDVVDLLIKRNCKMRMENRKGYNPCDVALSWADGRIYEAVRLRWDSLPPPEKKKPGAGGGKAGKKQGAKRSRTNTPGDASPKSKPVAVEGRESPLMLEQARQRKGSILRAASALAGGLEEEEDITYMPLHAWTKQKRTLELIRAKQINRDRFGYEVDFPDFQMPFAQNCQERVVAEGGFDED